VSCNTPKVELVSVALHNQHPQKEEIGFSLLRDGTRDAATRFGVSRSALDRHKRHLPDVLVKAHVAQEVAASSSLLSQIKGLTDEFRTIAAKALAAQQWSAATAALREVRACMEFTSKLENGSRQPSKEGLASLPESP
jgi:hypothetical protein